MNKVGPYNNPQETYNYYYLPFCKPNKPGKPAHKWGGLGEVRILLACSCVLALSCTQKPTPRGLPIAYETYLLLKASAKHFLLLLSVSHTASDSIPVIFSPVTVRLMTA